MEIRVLKYFLTICREENITKAAEVLNITQPTLSRQIQQLEEELEQKLFIRESHKVSLTEEGMLLRKRAEEIVLLSDKTLDEFNALKEEYSGDIYIGAGESESISFLAKAMKNINQKYPQIHFHIFSGNADDVCEKLERGVLDFGLVIGTTNVDKYHKLDLPFYDTFGILLQASDPLAQKNSLSFDEIQHKPLIVPRQSHRIVEQNNPFYALLNQQSRQIISTYNLAFNASILVKNNLGYALTLDKLVDTSESSGLKFVPLEPLVQAKLTIIWKKYQILSKPASLFLKELQQLLNK